MLTIQLKNWLQDNGPWWLCSFVFHVVLVCSLALVSGRVVEKISDEAPVIEEANVDKPPEAPQEIERFEVGETPEEPTDLNTATLAMEKPTQVAREEKYDDAPSLTEKNNAMAASNLPSLGGLGGFDVRAVGPAAGKGKSGAFAGTGMATRSGHGDSAAFSGRATPAGKKAMLGSGGGTRQSERAVAGALNWIARHQLPGGNWSFTLYKSRCKDATCSGPLDKGRDGPVGPCDTAATAMALLPFFAAGQTHEGRGRYKQNIYAGVSYLLKAQKPNGDLRSGGVLLSPMYAHALAALALCECYGMSNDKAVGRAAQAALNFTMDSQSPDGSWGYDPHKPSDISITGFHMQALKSGMVSYLTVNPATLERARKFMMAASVGTRGKLGAGSMFGYKPGMAATPTMTAVGLLLSQYLGASRTDPAMIEGTAYLMKHQPDNEKDNDAFMIYNKGNGGRNIYYWYYATQVLHNQPGPDWDVWNRKIRRILIDTQAKEGCAAGSWDPWKPKKDEWADYAGRLYITSLSALTLEVYYRYLPLYKLDGE